jgi:putative PIN family toxin of toxin-antitoxin system
MKTPRVVLDTNCLVSALLFKSGRLAVLRYAWQRGVIQPIVCKETVSELIRVLAYPKFRLSRADIDILLAEFLPFTETRRVKNPAAPVPGLSDPADAVFIHLAKQSQADMLVSGDAHLMGVDAPEVRIIAPVSFLKSLGE